jgi:hypothetical protein
VTSSLSWKRSYQLSYAPCAAVYCIGFDLTNSGAFLILQPSTRLPVHCIVDLARARTGLNAPSWDA